MTLSWPHSNNLTASSVSINPQHLRSMLPSSLEQARSHLPEDMPLKNVKSVMLQSDKGFGGFYGSLGIWRMEDFSLSCGKEIAVAAAQRLL